MLIEKFIEFFDNLIKCSQQTKEKNSKIKENNLDVINDYKLEDKSKKYIEKHAISLINSPLNKFIENKPNEKYSTYLKLIQNIYCDISEMSNLFPNFKSLKMVLKLYFITMRTFYYNNQKFSKILIPNEDFSLFIDFYFKDIFLYALKIFPNINIDDKNSINNLEIEKNLSRSFIGETLPFIINNESEIQIPLDILYNNSDYRYDIMKNVYNKGITVKKYFEKQEKYLKDINKDIFLAVVVYFLNEIKEKYFVERFIKYLEFNENDKKIILSNTTTK